MDEEDFSDIVSAVQLGDLDVIVDAIETKIIDAKAVDKDGCSLLHWAAINNRCEVARYLIDNGANVNAAGGLLMELPLAWAVRKNFQAMVLLLLQSGSDINHYNKAHLTVLHLAFKQGDLNLIFMLLYCGADPNVTDRTGESLLLWLIKGRIHPEQLIDHITLLRNYNVDIAGTLPSSAVAPARVSTPTPRIGSGQQHVRSNDNHSGNSSSSSGSGKNRNRSSSSSNNSNTSHISGPPLAHVVGDSALHLLCRAFNDDTALYSLAIEELLKTSGGNVGSHSAINCSNNNDSNSSTSIHTDRDNPNPNPPRAPRSIHISNTNTGIRELQVDELVFHCRNEADESPFDMAWNGHNAILLKLFMDLWLHEHNYSYTPAIVTGISVLAFFTILRTCGWSTWSVILNVINISVFLCFSQLSILKQIGRVCVGATTGLIFTYFTCYLAYMSPLPSSSNEHPSSSSSAAVAVPQGHVQALNGSGIDSIRGEGVIGEMTAEEADVGYSLAIALLVLICFLLVLFHRTSPAHLHAKPGVMDGVKSSNNSNSSSNYVENDVENVVPVQSGAMVALAATAAAAHAPLMQELVSYHQRTCGMTNGNDGSSGSTRALGRSELTTQTYQHQRANSSNNTIQNKSSPMHRSTSGHGLGMGSGGSGSSSVGDFQSLSRASTTSSTTMGLAAMGCEEDRYSEYTAQQTVPLVATAVSFHLCSVCLVNQVRRKGRSRKAVPPPVPHVASIATHVTPPVLLEISAIHCPYCRSCTLEADHHCMYLGNCVGRGNIRSYCCFLLVGSVSTCLWFLSALSTQYRGGVIIGGDASAVTTASDQCLLSYPPGMAWFNRLWIQTCLLETDPAFFVLTWLALALTLYLSYSLYQQLLFVVYKTTSYYALEKNYPLVLPPPINSGGVYSAPPPALTMKQIGRILFKFLWTGRFAIAPLQPDSNSSSGFHQHHNRSESAEWKENDTKEEDEEEEDDYGGMNDDNESTALVGNNNNTASGNGTSTSVGSNSFPLLRRFRKTLWK